MGVARILNVDDNEAARYATGRILRHAGFEVQDASCGADTLALARSGPDLIVLDLNLPDISGFDVCRRLKSDPATATIPVLHLTSTYQTPEHWSQALETGADGYLTQPVDARVLVATVRSLLRARTAEIEARGAARHWNTTFESVRQGVALLDADGKVVRCNAAMGALVGRKPEELVGSEVVASLPSGPEPPEGWPFHRARITRRRETSVVWDGRRWWEVAADPVFDERGQFAGAVRILSDVTDRKLRDERIRILGEVSRKLFEAAQTPEAIGTTVAEELARVLGAACVIRLLSEDRRSLALLACHHPEPEARAWLAAALRSEPADAPLAQRVLAGEPVRIDGISAEQPGPFIRPDQRSFIERFGMHSLLVLPLRGASDVLGTIALSRNRPGPELSEEEQALLSSVADRTGLAVENARLLAAEQRARMEAERANRVKDEFLATLSHELRTPLNAIMGWAQLLRGGALDPSMTGPALETILRNASAQARLIDDMLDISAIAAGQVRLQVRPMDLAEVVKGAIESERPGATAKGLGIEGRLAGPCWLLGDPDRLRQVTVNLLSNAIRFTSAGGRIVVALRTLGSEVELSVADDGAGIDPSLLPLVFERFQRGEAVPGIRGLGLGLALVRHFVDLHGGRVRAESAGRGRGSRFVVVLPVALDARPGEAGRPAGESPPAQPCPTLLAGVRVLAVDDDPDVREGLRLALQSYGAEVATAGSVGEALERVQAEPPHVLVADIAMPGEDGFVLVRRVRALPPERGGATLALALTGYARDEDRRRVIDAGFQAYAAKPMAPDQLARTIASLVRARS